jgi:DNA-binding GntR family transcriptional regulator
MPRKSRLLMQQAHDEIKRRIVTLELRPGQRLDDIELAAQLKLSRTPIREAIFLLGSEGLVDINDDTGIIVRPLDLVSTGQLLEVHLVLVKAVSRLVAARRTAAHMDALNEAARAVEVAVDGRDPLAVTSTNAEFHRREGAATGNPRLQAMVSSVEDERQRLAYVCFGGTHEWGHLDDHFRKVVDDHRRLIDAYDSADADSAEEVAVSHVRLFRDRIVQFLTVEEPKYSLASDLAESSGLLNVAQAAHTAPV